MCEFCIQHGEGKRWYELMQNYSQELFHAQLHDEERNLIGYGTRRDWLEDFIKSNVVPAAGWDPLENEIVGEEVTEKSALPRDEAEILRLNKMEHFGQVLPIEDVEKVLSCTDSITRMPCACRYFESGITNARYCFGLGVDVAQILGKYPDQSASFELMDKDEALKLIRHFDNEGLMHSVWSCITPFVGGLCNCDGDCAAYRGYIKNRGRQAFFRAEYICQIDPDQCNGCKECMAQCQFGAQFYSSAMGKVTIEPRFCYGCGVCRAACPQGAIELVPRAKIPEAMSIW